MSEVKQGLVDEAGRHNQLGLPEEATNIAHDEAKGGQVVEDKV